MTDIERQRLAAVLGMLGSSSAGERDNAARLAEQFRIQHNLTWAQLVDGKTIYVDREVTVFVYREVTVEKTVFVRRDILALCAIPFVIILAAAAPAIRAALHLPN
jgi:hypothetical protein